MTEQEQLNFSVAADCPLLHVMSTLYVRITTAHSLCDLGAIAVSNESTRGVSHSLRRTRVDVIALQRRAVRWGPPEKAWFEGERAKKNWLPSPKVST